MVKALVTGAGGFIGCHVERFLKKKGYWVRSLDLRPSPYVQSCSDEFVIADLRKWESCVRATDGIQEVFSFAALAGGIRSTEIMRAQSMRDNVLVDAHLMEACRQNGVRKVFFPSSDCVYPAPDATSEQYAMKEDDAYPAFPVNEYGWEKLFTERMYRAYWTDFGLETRIGRLHNVFGPFSSVGEGKAEKVMCALCRKVSQARDGETIEIWGDGSQARSFLYIDECLEGIWRLMNSECREPLNIGSDRAVTIDEMADMVIAVSGRKLDKIYDRTKPSGARGRCSDNTRIKSVLNWAPSGEIRRGLEETYQWVTKQLESSKTP